MAAKPRYMKLRYNVWNFRMAVPKAHQEVHGTMVQHTLGTSDQMVAQAMALAEAARWKAEFAGIPLPTAGNRADPNRA